MARSIPVSPPAHMRLLQGFPSAGPFYIIPRMPAAPFSSLLVVCTGNICRSPIAEALFRARLQGLGEFAVASAGTGALVGHPADDKAIEVMDERKVDLRAHRARQFDLALARDFDLTLVMEEGQRRWIQQSFPTLRGRVRLLGQWLDDLEVPDPFGRELGEFRQARDLIEEAVDAWMARIGGTPAARPHVSHG